MTADAGNLSNILVIYYVFFLGTLQLTVDVDIGALSPLPFALVTQLSLCVRREDHKPDRVQLGAL